MSVTDFYQLVHNVEKTYFYMFMILRVRISCKHFSETLSRSKCQTLIFLIDGEIPPVCPCIIKLHTTEHKQSMIGCKRIQLVSYDVVRKFLPS